MEKIDLFLIAWKVAVLIHIAPYEKPFIGTGAIAHPISHRSARKYWYFSLIPWKQRENSYT